MKLVHLIQPDRIFLNLDAKTLEDAIKIMVPKVQKDCTVEGRKCLTQDVLDRERLVSTIVGHRVALPHTRSEEISEMTIGLGVFPRGMTDPTPDNLPVKIVFLLLEQKRVSKLYLKTLGVLAKLAMAEGAIDKIIKAATPREVVEIISSTNLVVSEKLTAGDISRRVEPARLGMNLKQVADLFFREDIMTLPVLDADDKVVGIVRCSDLLGAAMPEYTRLIGGLSFLSEFEPFDRFLHEEDKVQVEKVTDENFTQVDENASIIEVTSLLLHHRENAVVVTKEGHYLGMLSSRYIITKVMRT